jgi:hypothetical protein
VGKKPTLHVDAVVNTLFMFKKKDVLLVDLGKQAKLGNTIG